MAWCDGVVFLDEYDRKMILVRATGRVVKLETCGVPAERRFAFYDQVHTTGMDIKHHDAAVAALTLGKDMTFRDLAQGAFRMRGIAKGQRVRVLIIPEVEDLITRELAAAKLPPPPTHVLSRLDSLIAPAERSQRVLIACVAWLTINSMRAERVQFNQLCVQNVTNVFRKVRWDWMWVLTATRGTCRLHLNNTMCAHAGGIVFRKVAFRELAATDAAAGRGRRLRALGDAASCHAVVADAGGGSTAPTAKTAAGRGATPAAAAAAAASAATTIPNGTIITAVSINVDGRTAPQASTSAVGQATGWVQFWWETPSNAGAMLFAPLRDAGSNAALWVVDDGPSLSLSVGTAVDAPAAGEGGGADAASGGGGLVATRAALKVFMEEIGFAVASDVPDPTPLHDTLAARVDAHGAFVRTAADRDLVDSWLKVKHSAI